MLLPSRTSAANGTTGNQDTRAWNFLTVHVSGVPFQLTGRLRSALTKLLIKHTVEF